MACVSGVCIVLTVGNDKEDYRHIGNKREIPMGEREEEGSEENDQGRKAKCLKMEGTISSQKVGVASLEWPQMTL